LSDYKISIVVPVYKEEKNIDPFLQRVEAIATKEMWNYEIIFCLDPSPDRTYELISQHTKRNSSIRLLQFSRRFGQPAATMAGIFNCTGDICVVIDVDLQDPPEVIPELIAKWQEGFNVVYAKRRSRKGETLFKKIFSFAGYKVINSLTDVQIPRNTGDFRIIDRTVIEELRKLKESHGFLRGLVAFVGFNQAFVEYDRHERFAGEGNYNRYFGSMKIGLNGLICYSSKPLQIISLSGIGIAILSFLLALWYLIQKVFIGVDLTPGLSTTVIVVSFFSGVQLLSLGIVGEYIGRIYEEVKNRPMYIISEEVSSQKKGIQTINE
jgi:glycosyltransferase involved in cell wall biosynthesis